jgi:hypothetical protein
MKHALKTTTEFYFLQVENSLYATGKSGKVKERYACAVANVE